MSPQSVAVLNPSVLSFLTDLKENNQRDWFAQNKKRFEEAKNSFEAFTDHLIQGIAVFEPELASLKAKDCVFRIYRDTRFSKDPSPYKTNMGAYMVKGGKKSPLAGYYLHIEPGGSFLAGGIHMPEKDVLKALRNGIYDHLDTFQAIIETPKFKKLFPELPGEKLKKAPLGFPPDFPGIEYLKLKEFTVWHMLSDEQVISGGFPGYLLEGFLTMKPFLDFLNDCLSEAF